jgi:hypothetical protein
MAGDTVAQPRSRAGSALIDRLAALIHQRGVRLALWTAAVVAEVAVLAPVVLRGAPVDPVDVILRLIGGSFAACGLIAWRRRPDSRSGLLMTATGFAFLVPALLRDHDSLVAATFASWLSDLWTLFFIPLGSPTARGAGSGPRRTGCCSGPWSSRSWCSLRSGGSSATTRQPSCSWCPIRRSPR